jgi:hypothetical protein
LPPPLLRTSPRLLEENAALLVKMKMKNEKKVEAENQFQVIFALLLDSSLLHSASCRRRLPTFGASFSLAPLSSRASNERRLRAFR